MTRIWNWGLLVLAPVAVLAFGACSGANSLSLSPLPTEAPPISLTQSSHLPPATTITQSQELQLRVSSPQDKAQLYANLVPVTGWVSESAANVLVNGVKATVDKNGNFAGYALVNEGENAIEVKASNGSASAASTVHVTFTPALVVCLDYPNVLGDNFNYLKQPVTVTGRVNKPQARVNVNSEEVAVAPDGSFTTEVWLKQNAGSGARIMAQATLGNETDEMYNLFNLADNGRVGPVPGYSIFFHARLITKSEITLKPGETTKMPLELQTKKDGPGKFSGRLVHVEREYGDSPLPDVPGLDVYLEPADFMAYSNTTYNFNLVLAASPDLPAGIYYFNFYRSLEKGFSGNGWIEVTVQ